MTGFLRRLRARLRYRHFNAELQQELDVHRAMAEDELRASGVTSGEVQKQAARQLGNVTLARESARGVWITPWLESVWQDVRYALRGLCASPLFTLPVLGVLVITMGLATSLFATTESIFFRPWPVADAHRVVSVVTEQHTPSGAMLYSIGGVEYRYLHDHAQSVDLIAMGSMSLPLGPGAGASSSRVRLVSGNYFPVLRTPIVAGRGLEPRDDEPGSAAVVVVSQGIWQRELGGTSNAVGATLLIRGVPFTVVGIAAAGAMDSPQTPAPDVWIPLHARAVLPRDEPAQQALLENTRGSGLQLAGRLEEGVVRQAADTEVKRLATRFAALHDLIPLDVAVKSTAWADQPMGERGLRTFSLLALATALMLLLGCANVGNLQLARGLSRRDDVAVRLALGASRGRLVRQLLVEGLVLAAIAAALSVVVAQHLPRWIILRHDASSHASHVASLVSIDGSVFVFVFALALGMCVIAGLLPALRTTRIVVRTRAAGTNHTRLRSTLLGLQVAISAILLVGTALLVRGVSHAAGSGLGFDPYGVAAVSFGLPQEGYDATAREQFSRRVVDAMTQSGASPFAGTTFVPFVSHRTSLAVRRPGGGDDERKHRAVTHHVTPGYFDLLNIPVVDGRVFDTGSSQEDVVINQALARLLWPDEPAVSRVFLDGDLERRVVAVVSDAQTENLNQISPIYYQSTGAFSALLVRNDPAAIANAQDVIRRLEPAASPIRQDFLTGLRNQLAPSIAGATTAAYIGVLALVLAAVGTLGVFSYLVNERVREIGVRLALGARARDIVGMLARRMSWPLVGGLIVGVLASLAMSRVIAGWLHGVSPYDPVAYLAILPVLALAAIVAVFVPARRAVRVDPAITLRHE